MSTPIAPISAINQTSSYNFFAPLMRALHGSADHLPKTSLPTEIPGTLLEDTHLLPPVTIYTQHGTVQSRPMGKLLGYA